jgi:hypothetical protein
MNTLLLNPFRHKILLNKISNSFPHNQSVNAILGENISFYSYNHTVPTQIQTVGKVQVY